VPKTGPFPYNNSGVTTAIIVSDKTFTGSLDNTGTIILGNAAPGITGFTGTGILVENNSTINGEISNSGKIEVALNGIIVAGTVNAIDKSNVTDGIVNGAAGVIASTNANGITVQYESKFSGGISNFGIVSADGLVSIGINVAAVSTFAGGIDNAGTVDAAIGIYIDNDAHFSGGVSNTGPIDAEAADIAIQQVAVFTGNITNKGALTTVFTSANAFVVSSVDFAAGGTFSGSIGNSGVISANKTGIKIDKVGLSRFSGGITNSGGITTATGEGVVITDVAGDGSFIGSIVNTGNIQSFGIGLVIAGIGTSSFDSVVVVGHGHHAKTTTGGISNSGAITSANAAGISIGEVAEDGTFTGNIVNSGAISGKVTGIRIGEVGGSDFFGGIANTGAITSTSGVGINIEDIANSGPAHFTEAIVNSGKIVAKSTGIIIQDVGSSRFSGGITNSGAITSADDQGLRIIGVAADGTFASNIVNTGALSAQHTGLRIGNVGASDFSGSIANSGAVTSTTQVGVDIDGNAGDGNFIGNIANSGAVSAKDTGVQINSNGATNFSGNIANTGTITSTSDDGIQIKADADRTFTGNITNSGTVSAKTTGVDIEQDGGAKFSGSITNSGAITSKSDVGIKMSDEAGNGTFTGNIANTGEVSAKETGVQIESDGDSKFSGDIVNTGVVTAKGNVGIAIVNIASDGTFTGSIANKGAVSAQATALAIVSIGSSGFSGGISNSGAIASTTGSGIAVNNIANNGKFSGTIANSGAVSAHKDGFDVRNVGMSSFSGTIGNSGAISAATGKGFSVQAIAGSGNFSGTIVNTGPITAHETAVLVEDVGHSGFSGTISNGGVISSTVDVGLFVSAVATDGRFNGNIVNTGAIVAKASGMVVESAGFSSFSGTISNGGKISSTTAVGIDVLDVVANGDFTGSIVNAGSISGFASGIAVSEIAATFTGSVVNSGVMNISNAPGIGIHGDAKVIGNVVNAATGFIAGETGIDITDSTIAGSVVDAGTIIATDAGIQIDGASKVSAAGTAVDITGASLTGAVINEGVIDGKVGVDVASAHGVNVFDEGTIVGSGGTAVELKAAGDAFTLGEGYVVSGAVVGTAGDALQLGGAIAASFNLSGINKQYKGFTAFNVVGGIWTMSGSGGGWNVEAGEMVLSGADVLNNSNVASGGTMVLSAGATFDTTSGGAAIIAGHVSNGGQIIASGGLMEFDGATIDEVGGFIQINNGVIRIEGNGNESVTFNDGDSGGLEISDNAGDANAYTGTIAGFGANILQPHTDTAEYIDLTSVTFAANKISGSYNSGTDVLTVSSSTTVVATIKFTGTYSGADFHFESGANGTVKITDPVVPDGGYVHHHHDHSDHVGHSANLGLFANYIATFGGEAHGNVLISSVGQIDPVPTLLVSPHR
jgi:hypothetical protein